MRRGEGGSRGRRGGRGGRGRRRGKRERRKGRGQLLIVWIKNWALKKQRGKKKRSEKIIDLYKYITITTSLTPSLPLTSLCAGLRYPHKGAREGGGERESPEGGEGEKEGEGEDDGEDEGEDDGEDEARRGEKEVKPGGGGGEVEVEDEALGPWLRRARGERESGERERWEIRGE